MAGPIRGVHANYDSELYAIYLLDAAKRRGVGKAMLAQTAAWLEAQDFKSMLVWVLSQNTATKFYEKIGGKKFETRIIEIGKPLEEVSYGWDDLSELANAAGQPI